ncbi:MAG TPA: YceH family protein [Gemmatimonadaceae bacterium]|jgi:hypothetical protein|nr:YceH family protein [Gemmatimonadaceae bacterium]
MFDPPLTDADVRVLGSLIEKEITTPDNYPLSLHGLAAACNQTSNRQPVVSLEEDAILAAITRLRRSSLVRAIQPADSRVMKYQHLAADAMSLDRGELALMCVLMLRGPQTVGELRSRTERLARFESLAAVEQTLEALAARTPAPFVSRLPRQPGQKDIRYAQILSGPPTAEAPGAVPSSNNAHRPSDRERVDALEARTATLETEIAELRRQLADFRSQFE